jgi:hypothetical protein
VGEIRTHEGLSPLAVFKTAAFNRSATTPEASKLFSDIELRKRIAAMANSPPSEEEQLGGCGLVVSTRPTTGQPLLVLATHELEVVVRQRASLECPNRRL